MRKNQTVRRILSFILSLTLVMGDIPVLPTVITANAGSDEVAVVSDDAVSEDAVSDDAVSDEPASVSADSVRKDNDSEDMTHVAEEELPENLISENVSVDGANSLDEKYIPASGLIEMPWDINVPTADDSLNIAEIDEMVAGEAVPVEGFPEKRAAEEIVGSVASVPSETIDASYPASYSNMDAINSFLKTLPVTRNQNPFGSCWAHAAIALAELYAVKVQGKEITDIDYSERHLAYYSYAQGSPSLNKDGVVLVEKCGDSISGNMPECLMLEKGGNVGTAAQNLMRWRGVASESTVPYPTDSDYTNVNDISTLKTFPYSPGIEYDDVARLENCYVINPKTNSNVLKQYIKAYGGVAVSFYVPEETDDQDNMDTWENYYNIYYNAFYYDGDAYYDNDKNRPKANHAVTIVGWDDSFPAENFKADHQPSSNGAWLIRNSWDAGKNTFGSFFTYFWLSYEDKSLMDSAFVYKLQAENEWLDNNYTYNSQYSGYGILKLNEHVEDFKSANIFTANGAEDYEILEAVTVQIMAVDYANVDYSVEIYTLPDNADNPSSGTKVSEESGVFPFRGIYTVKLDNPVKLQHGQKFAVVVTLNGLSTVDYETDIKPYTVNGYTNSTNAKCGGEGQSFYYLNYKWNDMYKEDHGNFCIGAQTSDINTNELTADDFKFSKPDFVYNTSPRSVSGCFLSPTDYKGSISYAYAPVTGDTVGTFSATLPVNAGTYQVQITAGETENYKEAVLTSESWRFTIAKAPLTVTANDKTIIYGDVPSNDGVVYSGFVAEETTNVLGGSLSYAYSYEQYDDVGSSYTITPSGLTSNNYTITFESGTLTVEQKAVGLSWSDTSLTFNGSAQAPTASVTGTENSDVISVTVAGAQTDAGNNYTATASALTGEKAGNYKLPSAKTTSFSIAKAGAQTIEDITLNRSYSATLVTALLSGKMPTDAGSITYNAGSASITKASGSSIVVSNFTVNEDGIVNVTITDGAAGDVITLPVTITSQNYEDSSVNVIITLQEKESVTVSFQESSQLTKTYGDTDFTLHASVPSPVSGGTWSWSSSNTDVATVTDGTVSIHKAGETDITATYESDTHLGSATIKLSVTKKPVTITGLSASDKEYDGTKEATVTGKAVVSGRVGTDDVSVTSGTASFDSADAGTGKTVSFNGFSLGDTAKNNYVLSAQPSSVKAAITAKEAVLNWTDTSFTYDGEPHCPKATVTNLIAGDSCSVNVSGAKTNANPEGSPYTATAISLTNNNYILPANKTTSFTIAKAELVLTAPEACTGLVYNGLSQALINGGSVNIENTNILYAITNTASAPATGSYTAQIPAATDAGDYYVWYKVPGTANYSEISADSIKVTIDRRVVSVNVIKAKNKTYDATTSAEIDNSSVVIEGRADQYLSIAADPEFEDADAGVGKTVNISNIRLTGSTSANYILSGSGNHASTAADINKRKVTVTALDQTVIVNQKINASVSMASLSGAVEGHTLYSVSLNADDTSHKTTNGVITAANAAISSNSADVTANYEIEYEEGNLTVILGEAAAVTTAPQGKAGLSYNAAAQALVSAGMADGGTLMYALGDDDETEPSSGWNETVPTAIDADTYYVWYKVFGNETHDDSDAVCIEVTIAQRDVTVKALDQSVSLNAAINGSVSMAQLSGQVTGHTLYSVTLTSGSTENVTASGEIIASNAEIRNGDTDVTPNYRITYAKGVLTVKAVEATVTTAPAARQLVYNAEAQQLVSSNAVAVGGEIRYALSTNGVTAPTEGFTPAIPTATDAGTYHVWYMVHADDNHVSTAPVCVDVTIVPAEYAIRYDKNDGSGAVVSQNKTIGKAGEKATISINDASREGYMFKGWNDKADGSGKPYKNGDEYTPVRKEDKSFADLTIYAQWEAVSLNSISINKAPDKTKYHEGENFDPTGMVVVANYTDASSKEVTAYTYTPSSNLALTDDKVTVSYTEDGITCTAEQPISVSENEPEITVSLNSISINKAPNKTEYLEGESFDPAGMVVVANYTDNSTKEVTNYTYRPDTGLSLTDKKITVSYTEGDITCTAEQAISVSANEPEATVSLNSISITTAPAKTAYKEGEKFDKTGMVVTATYTDESTKEVTDYTIDPSGELKIDDKKITVSYTEGKITCTAELKISVSRVKTEEEEVITEDEDYFIWNLYEDSTPKTLKIKGVSVNETVTNSNSKSSAFYKATLCGSDISVSVIGNLKNAAKAENTLLEFKTADGGIIEYTLPVEYKKPVLKLSTTSATIKKGTASKVQTTVLYKTAGGNFEPLDLTGGEVKYDGKAAEILEDGVISFTTSNSGKGKISITGKGWNANDPIELTFTIKASKKDVLYVDLGGAKDVVINRNIKGQSFEYPVYLNGEKAGALDIEDKAKTGLAHYADGILTISDPTGWNLKPKTYTITLSNGDVKANVKIRVTNKDLSKSISLKLQSKYDVVTGQKMVIVPTLKDIDGELTGVSVTDKNYSAVINEAGNIVVDYSGDALDAKHLKIGNLTFKLKISDVEEEIPVTIKNVKAKKSSINVKAAKVKLNGGKTGVANLICSYKDSAGNLHLIAPISTYVVKPTKVKAVVSDDPTVINISDLSGKSGSIKLKLTFAGGVTKTVTVKVAK